VLLFGDKSYVGVVDASEINITSEKISEQPHKVILKDGLAGSYELSIETVRT